MYLFIIAFCGIFWIGFGKDIAADKLKNSTMLATRRMRVVMWSVYWTDFKIEVRCCMGWGLLRSGDALTVNIYVKRQIFIMSTALLVAGSSGPSVRSAA